MLARDTPQMPVAISLYRVVKRMKLNHLSSSFCSLVIHHIRRLFQEDFKTISRLISIGHAEKLGNFYFWTGKIFYGEPYLKLCHSVWIFVISSLAQRLLLTFTMNDLVEIFAVVRESVVCLCLRKLEYRCHKLFHHQDANFSFCHQWSIVTKIPSVHFQSFMARPPFAYSDWQQEMVTSTKKKFGIIYQIETNFEAVLNSGKLTRKSGAHGKYIVTLHKIVKVNTF